MAYNMARKALTVAAPGEGRAKKERFVATVRIGGIEAELAVVMTVIITMIIVAVVISPVLFVAVAAALIVMVVVEE